MAIMQEKQLNRVWNRLINPLSLPCSVDVYWLTQPQQLPLWLQSVGKKTKLKTWHITEPNRNKLYCSWFCFTKLQGIALNCTVQHWSSEWFIIRCRLQSSYHRQKLTQMEQIPHIVNMLQSLQISSWNSDYRKWYGAMWFEEKKGIIHSILLVYRPT